MKPRSNDPLTARRVEELLDYNPQTGDFHWRARMSSRVPAGMLAGYINNAGRRIIKIDGLLYPAHRLAFMYMTGAAPDIVDHKDRDPLNNRWDNLRSATAAENSINARCQSGSKTGVKGVKFYRKRNRYRATMRVNGKRRHFGRYCLTALEAHQVYMEECRRVYGEFAPIDTAVPINRHITVPY